jgi:hypothetical protein
MLECLVGPLKSDNLTLRDYYTRAFEQFPILEQDVEVFLRAADLRTRHDLRTPDALHLALCDELWTDDDRLAAGSAAAPRTSSATDESWLTNVAKLPPSPRVLGHLATFVTRDACCTAMQLAALFGDPED